jgi:hypothetical protein
MADNLTWIPRGEWQGDRRLRRDNKVESSCGAYWINYFCADHITDGQTVASLRNAYCRRNIGLGARRIWLVPKLCVKRI